jgi:hypothetical protein
MKTARWVRIWSPCRCPSADTTYVLRRPAGGRRGRHEEGVASAEEEVAGAAVPEAPRRVISRLVSRKSPPRALAARLGLVRTKAEGWMTGSWPRSAWETKRLRMGDEWLRWRCGHLEWRPWSGVENGEE